MAARCWSQPRDNLLFVTDAAAELGRVRCFAILRFGGPYYQRWWHYVAFRYPGTAVTANIC
jgi:hypothetical protein